MKRMLDTNICIYIMNKQPRSVGDRLVALRSEVEQARTIAVNTIVVVEAAYLFACRSLRYPIWRIGLFSNLWVWLGAGVMLIAQMIFIYVPARNRLFHTSAIVWIWWLYFTIAGFIVLAAVETYELVALRRRKKG